LLSFSSRYFSSRLLSENAKIKTHITIILPVVLYGCDTLFLTLIKEHRLRVLGNRVLRSMFLGLREKKNMEVGENCIMKSFTIRIPQQILL
jgi:hypothetical protein